MDKLSKIMFAKKRIAINNSFDAAIFDLTSNVFIKSESAFFEMMTFGNHGIFLVNEELYDWCIDKFNNRDIKKVMDGEDLYLIETKLRQYNKKLGGEHVRYLYLSSKDVHKPSGFTYKLYDQVNIHELDNKKEFSNALNFKNDVIAYGAYDGDKLVALAGADNVMNDLWQIGIDTLKDYRNKGLGVYLVKTLADEIEKHGRLPFYTTWSPNIASTKLALSAGFEPVWVEYFSKELVCQRVIEGEKVSI